MCGIVGYTGTEPCQELLLDGLAALEYRGYDSAGIALQDGDVVSCVRAVGNLASLRAAVTAATSERAAIAAAGSERTAVAVAASESAAVAALAVATWAARTGIGHTRWATHGTVSERNAHPHADPTGRFHIVLNGIIENHLALRGRFGADAFASETDAEVVAHLVAHHYQGDLAQAVHRTCAELEGHYAFVAMAQAEPGVLVATRRECPLVIGTGATGVLVASSINAMAAHARRVITLQDGDVATLTAGAVHVQNAAGEAVVRPVSALDARAASVDKGAHETYMLKEIHEQPATVAATLRGRVQATGAVHVPELGRALRDAPALGRVVVVGCGTSYHAGLVGRHAIEEWAGVPVEIDVASELRYRSAALRRGDLVIALTQSGETADTLAAVRQARAAGATVVAVTNVADSQITREADAVLLTHAGVEIGVAATKSYVVQLVAMYVIALELGRRRATLAGPEQARLAGELLALPERLRAVIDGSQAAAQRFADTWAQAPFFLYLGRHAGLPVAMEGALKLKEVSYLPAEAYAAGEMKHGPIALLDRRTPVVCVATDTPVLTKLLGNMSEVRAREATVLAIATAGTKQAAEHASDVIYVPRSDWLLQPVLAAVPLQLLAYHVARRRGANVDQPRNLAKTVTVE